MPRSTTPLSILHVLAPARFGGLETAVTVLAAAQIEAGQRVAVALVLTPEDGAEHPVAVSMREQGIPVTIVEVAARDYLGERREVATLLRRNQVRVLHTHGYRPELIDAPVARRMGIATVTTVHGFTGGGIRNRTYEWLQRRSFRRFDAVIAVSDLLRRELRADGLDHARIHMIRNAWRSVSPPLGRTEARRRLGLPSHRPVVGWVGRLSHEKAPDVMLRSLPMMRTPQVSLSFIGDGPMLAGCQALAAELKVADEVRWHGIIDAAGTCLKAFDVLALTSHTEGTPMVLLEAMSAGVPVVTTSVGGIPDVVSSAEALLCDPERPDQIAEAVDAVLGDQTAAAERAKAARQRLTRDFSVECWAERHREIYHTIIES